LAVTACFVELLLLATVVYWARFPEDPFVPSAALAWLTVGIAALGLIAACWRRFNQAQPQRWAHWSATLFYLGVSGSVAVQAISTLPHPLNNGSVPQENIANYPNLYGLFIAAHAIVSAVVVWRQVRGCDPIHTGFLLFAVLWSVNGQFFHVMTYFYHLEDYYRLPYAPCILAGLTLTLAVRALDRTPALPKLRPQGIALGCFLSVSVLSSLSSLYPNGSLYYTFWLLNGAAAGAVIALYYRGKPAQVRQLLTVPVAGAVLVSVIAIWRVLGTGWALGLSFIKSTQATLPAVHYSAVAMYLLIGLGIALGLHRTAAAAKHRAWLRAAIVLLFVATILTRSKSGWFGLAVILLGTGLSYRQSSRKLKLDASLSRVARLGAPILIVLAVLLAIAGAERSIRTRWSLWQVVTRVVAAYPVLGAGPGIYYLQPAFVDVNQSDTINAIRLFLAVHAHNLFLEVAEGTGLLGLFFFLTWLSLLAVYLKKQGRLSDPLQFALGVTVLAFIAANLWDLSLALHTLLPVEWWLLLAALDVGARRDEQQTERRLRAPGWRRALTAGVAIVIALLCVVRPLAAEMFFRQATIINADDVRDPRQDPRPALLQLAARLDPLNPKIPEWTAKLAVRASDSAGALVAYGQAARLRQAFPPYEHRLGLLDWMRQQVDKAEHHFEAAANGDPGNVYLPRSMFDLALIKSFRGKDDEAVQAFARDLRLRFIGAKDFYLKYFAKTPAKVQPEYALKAEFRPGPVTFSLTQELWVVLRDGEGADELRPEGLLRPRTDNLSLDQISMQLERDLENPALSLGEKSWVTQKIGELHEMQGRHGAARTWYTKLLDFPFRRDYANYLLGRVAVVMGNHQRAEQHFRTSHYWEDLSEFMTSQGRIDDAIDALRHQRPQFGIYSSFYKEPYWRLGDLYLQKGDLDKALKCYQKAVFIIGTVQNHMRIGEVGRVAKQRALDQGLPPELAQQDPYVQFGISGYQRALDVYQHLDMNDSELLASIKSGLGFLITGGLPAQPGFQPGQLKRH